MCDLDFGVWAELFPGNNITDPGSSLQRYPSTIDARWPNGPCGSHVGGQIKLIKQGDGSHNAADARSLPGAPGWD